MARRRCMTGIDRDERGLVLPLVAIMLVALLGMVALAIDIGQIAVTRRQLQNAVDAAALAGVQVLPDATTDATNAAQDYVQKNGVALSEIVSINITKTNVDNDTISVTARRKVNYSFAKVLNLDFTNVTLSASAVAGSVTGGSGIMPFGILDENGEATPGTGIPFNSQIRLKAHEGGSWRSGNRGYLAFDEEHGGSNLREVLGRGGSKTRYKAGDWVPTEPGNKTGPGRDGLEDWATSHHDSMYGSDCNDWDSSHSYVHGKLAVVAKCQYRVVLVPVIKSECDPSMCWPNGRKDVKILGFAQVYIAGWADPGDEKDLNAIFLDDSWFHPDITFGGLNSYGTRVVRINQ